MMRASPMLVVCTAVVLTSSKKQEASLPTINNQQDVGSGYVTIITKNDW
jgi:hypothetical protein